MHSAARSFRNRLQHIACTVGLLDIIDRLAYITLEKLVTSINADKPSDQHEYSADASPASVAVSH